MTLIISPVKMTELGLDVRVGMTYDAESGWATDVWVGDDESPTPRLRCTGANQHAVFTQTRQLIQEEVAAGLWPEALTKDKWAAALHRLYLKEHATEYEGANYDPEYPE
jgi:hypothetical protein